MADVSEKSMRVRSVRHDSRVRRTDADRLRLSGTVAVSALAVVGPVCAPAVPVDGGRDTFTHGRSVPVVPPVGATGL